MADGKRHPEEEVRGGLTPIAKVPWRTERGLIERGLTTIPKVPPRETEQPPSKKD
jgi:hypothetical protein